MLLILLGALLERVVPAWAALTSSQHLQLLGTDGFYQLRQAEYAIANFPELQRTDPWTHYPLGQHATTPGLFTLSIALLSLPWPDRVSQVAAWLPVILGLATFWAVIRLSRLLNGDGRWAALMLLLYPGLFVNRTTFGKVDHHAAECLLVTLTLYGLVWCWKMCARSQRWPFAGLVASAPLALFQFTWVGAPLYMVVMVATLITAATAELACTGRGWIASRVSLTFGVGLSLTIGVIGWLAPNLVMSSTGWQGALGGALATAIALSGLLYGCDFLAKRFNPAAAVFVLLATCTGAGLAVWSVDSLQPVLTFAFGERFFFITEHRGADLGFALSQYGLSAIFATFLLVLVFLKRDIDASLLTIAIAYTVFVVLLWVKTHDLYYVLGPLFALLAGRAVEMAVGYFPCKWKALTRTILVTCLIAYIWPLHLAGTPWVTPSNVHLDQAWREAAEWLREETPPIGIKPHQSVVWAGNDYQYPPGTYGVWVNWQYGNLVTALGERPVNLSQGAERRTIRWWLHQDEEAALSQLGERTSDNEYFRYVVIDHLSAADRFLTTAVMITRSLMKFKGDDGYFEHQGRRFKLRTNGSDYERLVPTRLYLDDGRGFSHLRLVYTSAAESLIAYRIRPNYDDPSQSRVSMRSRAISTSAERQKYQEAIDRVEKVFIDEDGYFLYRLQIEPSIKIYEQVRGAILRGHTEQPGALVRVNLELRSKRTGKLVEYSHETHSLSDGSFELTVPYVSEATGNEAGNDFVALSPYLLRVVDTRTGASLALAEIDVSQSAVMNGLTLDVVFNI